MASLPPILPVGTSVVTLRPTTTPGAAHPKGAAGVVAQLPVDPQHKYLVRLSTGDDIALRRDEIGVLSQFNDAEFAAPDDAMAQHDLSQYMIYRCVIGSRAYGLDRDASDTDRRGVYLPPADMQWSLYGVPEQLENDATQECYWELAKYLRLALKANPNVLETLYSPIVEHAAPIAQRLLAMRDRFLSKLVFQTFNGYAMSQFRKIEQDLRNQGQIKWKHAMHLLRLLLSGIHALKHGELQLRVDVHRDTLLEVRDGQMPWDELDRWRHALHVEFEQTYASSHLPDRPDYAAANALLIDARREMAEHERGNL